MPVTIYTKTGCPHCAAAKDSFIKQKIKFSEINVTDNPDKIRELEKLAGVRKVPVIITDGRVSVGFNGGT